MASRSSSEAHAPRLTAPKRKKNTHPTPEAYQAYHAPHLYNGRFYMPWMEQTIKKSFKDVLAWQMQSGRKFEKKRGFTPSIEEKSLDKWHHLSGDLKVMWLGHASFLIELNEKTILIDPVFGDVNTLVRRQTPFPFDVSNLPHIDVVLLTHGHYDHLNVRSLGHLAKHSQDTAFLVPKGQAPNLPSSCKGRVQELDWWEQVTLDDVHLTFLPSQHWHQRGPFDYNKALWGGWWIHASDGSSFYHMGDSGYFGGFEAIRDAMGSPDVMALPAGAYEPRWFMKLQHMNPEEAWRVWETLGAAHVIPMHHGTFDLSDEPLDQGIVDFQALCDEDRAREEKFIALPHGGSVSFMRDERVDA